MGRNIMPVSHFLNGWGFGEPPEAPGNFSNNIVIDLALTGTPYQMLQVKKNNDDDHQAILCLSKQTLIAAKYHIMSTTEDS